MKYKFKMTVEGVIDTPSNDIEQISKDISHRNPTLQRTFGGVDPLFSYSDNQGSIFDLEIVDVILDKEAKE